MNRRYLGRIDALLKVAHEAGVEVMGQFGCTPSWAADPDAGGPRASRPPKRPNLYGRAVSILLRRFGCRLAALEVRNEPNHYKFWTGSASQYVATLKSAHAATKQIAPWVVVVSGGTGGSDTGWLRRFIAAGGGGYADVIAVHPYPLPRDLPPEELTYRNDIHRGLPGLVEVKRLLDDHGLTDKPIWVTEIGWSVHRNRHDPPEHRRGVTEMEQADYLARTLEFLSSDRVDVERVFWFTSRDRIDGDLHANRFGLFRSDLAARESFSALRSWRSSHALEEEPALPQVLPVECG